MTPSTTPKGTKVTPTEHATKTAKATTPLFALLCGLLPAKGTGAPSSDFPQTKTPKRRSSILLSLLTLLVALALSATPALAGSSHIYSHHLGEGRGEAAGELELTAPVLFDKPAFSPGTPKFNVAGSGVAVNDETHDVYVADTGNRRVDEFEADGTFIRTFGKDVNKTKVAEGVLASEAEKDVCTGTEECQKGAAGSEPGALEAPNFVAVDNDLSSPSHGDVYVGTGVGKEAEDELQYITFPGAASGTYTLTFEGETTGPIAFTLPFGEGGVGGPDAVAAREALEKLPKLKGNIFVAEDPRNGGYLQIEFRGSLTETAVPLLGCDSSELAPAPVTCEVEIGNPGAHHVGEIVSKFSSNGTLQASWGTGGQLDGSGASGSGDFAALGSASGKGEVTEGSKVITNIVTSTGAFAVGQGVSVESGYATAKFAFPPDTVITSVGPGATLTVSNPSKFSSDEESVPLTNIATDTVVTNVVTANGAFATGQEISAAGIPAGTRITAIEAGVLVLSSNATAGGTGVALAAHQAFEGQLNGIAVDTSGDLWVSIDLPGDGATIVYEFGQEGAFTKSFRTEPGLGDSAGGIAVGAPGEVHYAAIGYSPGGASGIALDTAEDEVYEDFGASIKSAREEFTSSTLEEGGGAGLAVDSSVGTAISSGTVYVANSSSDLVEAFGIALGVNPSGPGAATQVTASVATLNGVIDPENLPVVECYFEYGETDEYGQSVPCEQGLGENPGEIGKGTSPVPVSVKLTGLHGGVTYHYRLVARNANGIVEGADEAFTTPTVPLVTGAEAANVTEGGAELRADVNPEGLQVSRCTFEYGTSTAYGARETCAQRKSAIGSGTAPVPVSAQISGLQPNTTYYWRLRVEDVDGEAFEPGHTFSYPTTTATSELPDHRAYEMVTPPFKNGASLDDVFASSGYTVADDGSRVVLPSIQCFAGSQSCTAEREGEGEPFAFTRTAGGWVTTPLAPSATQFSEDTAWLTSAEGSALFSMPTGPAGEDEWYKREEDGSFVAIGPSSPPGGEGNQPIKLFSRAGTADLSHLVWVTKAPFWPFDHTNPEKSAGDTSLYEYVGTGNKAPFLVGVNEKGEQLGTCGAELGTGGRAKGSDEGALSADGRTVYFTMCESELYARVDGGEPEAHTVKISAPQCEDSECRTNEARPSAAFFESASEDGSEAFFLDTQQLTDQATQGTGTAKGNGCHEGVADCNLYESLCTAYCEQAGEERALVDVSAVPAGDTRGPEVQGVLAVSADGSHVYFVANGILTAEPNDQGAKARPGHCVDVTGTCNLYVYERDARYPDGHLAFVASLPASDSGYEDGRWIGSANVSPDGRFLVFASRGELTRDDTTGGAQIFRYDAETEQLQRVSIGQDGYDDDGNAGAGEATIVKPGELKNLGPQRRDPTMADDGARIFFETPIALTAHALDDVVISQTENAFGQLETVYAENVYEWEQEGAGSCPAGQSTGCVYLISDGHDTSDSAGGPCANRGGSAIGSATCLMGTDATGSNVFFTTADRLVPRDTDTQLDVYDARVCEPENGNPCITEPPPALPPCDGENCHGIPEPTPSLLAPGSASFNGEGNVASSAAPPPAKKVTKKAAKCHRGFVKNKKNRCVKKKSRKQSKQAKKTNRGTK
jgi:hypothetical protein